MFIIFSLCLSIIWARFIYEPIVTKKPITIEIQRGDTGHHLAEQLADKGNLWSPVLFRLLLKLRGQSRQIQAGEYQIAPGTLPNELIKQMVAGDVVMHPFTIVNGHNSYQIIKQLRQDPNVKFDFDKPATPKTVAKQLGLPYPSIEGVMLPNTYLFPKGALASQICLRAYQKMQRALKQAWKNRSQQLNYNKPYQALIVASMIEKETALTSEMPIIADIILKRWHNHRRLQIDASVIYGLLPDHYNGQLTKQLLRKKTPYNTYIHRGLPPTPISMPSLQALHASLHPKETAYWYYVAKGEGGSHHFSKTLSGQQQAINRYQHQAGVIS